MLFQANYRDIIFKTILIYGIPSIYPIKYFLGYIDHFSVQGYFYFIAITTFVGLLAIWRYYKEVEFLDDRMIVKNILSGKLLEISYSDIVSISETNFPLGGMEAHYILIKTKVLFCSIYPNAIEEPELFKQVLEEKWKKQKIARQGKT